MTTLGALLTPYEFTLGLVVRPADVGGQVAFDALVRDRVLSRVRGDTAVPRGVAVTATIRAASLAAHVPRHAVVHGASAAWVHAGGTPPQVLDLVCPGGSSAPRHRPGVRMRYFRLLAMEHDLLDVVRVTTPLRTVLDIASAPHATETPAGSVAFARAIEDAAVEVLRLCRATGLNPGGAARALALKYRWTGREEAEEVLARAACLASADLPH